MEALARIERKYSSLGDIYEEMRSHVKDSLTRSEKSKANSDESSHPTSVISFQRDTTIKYGVSTQGSGPSSAWMDRQPHRTQVS
jgi:hypothetical protein